MDRIEDITVEQDEGSLVLYIGGDFVSECEDYLGDDEAAGMNFLLSPDLAADLIHQLRQLGIS